MGGTPNPRRGKITQEEVRLLLDYEPATGILRWKIATSNVKAGDIAGAGNSSTGYKVIIINKVNYAQSRLIWFYVHGIWPANRIDHVNGIKTDNRLCNLREATIGQNAMNSGKRRDGLTSKYRGVHYDKARDKWRADFRGKCRRFSSEEEAHEFYVSELRKYNESFPTPLHPDYQELGI